MEPKQVPLIGIAGGIASGKSFIAQLFERHGAAVISADRLAHEVLKEAEVKQRARERWGEKIFGTDGQIDRQALGRIVFAPPPEGPRELKHLEQLTHPEVGKLVRARMDELAADPTTRAIVLDVPLLFESGWNRFCDKTLFVEASDAARRARAAARGWSAEDFARREAVQESLETKRALADVVINNTGSPESAQAQIEQFWHSLTDTSRLP